MWYGSALQAAVDGEIHTNDRKKAVLLDVEEGLLSVEKAEEAYGVILKETAEGLAVDEEKTREARAGKTGQKAEVYDLGEKRRAYEAVWTPEASDRLAQLLQERPFLRDLTINIRFIRNWMEQTMR